jgi:hypothetical protein
MNEVRKTTLEKLIKVRDFIKEEKEDYIFNMAEWYGKTSCGTVACIAGTVVMLYRPAVIELKLHKHDLHVFGKEARQVLNLTHVVEGWLFGLNMIDKYSGLFTVLHEHYGEEFSSDVYLYRACHPSGTRANEIGLLRLDFLIRVLADETFTDDAVFTYILI